MEKVKLTREQAEAIEWLRKVHHDSEIVARNAVLRERGEKEDSRHRKLFKIGLHELIKALYIGYEVKETFEVGDWVKVNWRDKKPSIHKVRRVNNTFAIIDGEQANTEPPIRIIEHATPEEIAEEKQRRWWARHGREVWELKGLDILINEKTGKMYEVDILKDETIRLWKIGVDGAFASDYKSAKEISKNVEVFCFAEDRKDVKS